MRVTDRGVAVDLDDECHEGYDGEYDPTDPEDRPLLRFTVLRLDLAGHAEPVDDASYCTRLVAGVLSEDEQRRVCDTILAEVGDRVRDGGSIKKLCEWLSWFDLSDVRKEEV